MRLLFGLIADTIYIKINVVHWDFLHVLIIVLCEHISELHKSIIFIKTFSNNNCKVM